MANVCTNINVCEKHWVWEEGGGETGEAVLLVGRTAVVGDLAKDHPLIFIMRVKVARVRTGTDVNFRMTSVFSGVSWLVLHRGKTKALQRKDTEKGTMKKRVE